VLLYRPVKVGDTCGRKLGGGGKGLGFVKTFGGGKCSGAPLVMTTRSTAHVEKSVLQEQALLFSKTRGITTTLAT